MTKISARPFLLSGAAAVGALALTVGTAASAYAHVGVSADTAAAGAYAILTVSVPHGCGTSPTTKIAIQIPEGINAVTPTRNSFYTVEKIVKTLDKPIVDGHGNQITERVSEVIYTATTPLPADQRDAFELSLKLPEDAAGTTLYFPIVQTCAEGETAWVQIPAAGQNADDLAEPAPAVAVTQASGGDHGHAPAATPAAQPATSGSSTPLTVTALIVGVLGLLAGGVALLRGRRQA